MTHALALGAQRVLLPALEALRPLDEVAQRLDARGRGAGVAGDLVAAPTCGGELPATPRAPRAAAQSARRR